MCGIRSKISLKNRGHGARKMLCLLLLLLLVLLRSLQADALTDLQKILTSYEQTTQSLSTRLKTSETNTQNLLSSTNLMKVSLNSLEINSNLQKILLDNQKESIEAIQTTLEGSSKQIANLQTGYNNMAASLKVNKTILKVVIGALVFSIGMNIFNMIV